MKKNYILLIIVSMIVIVLGFVSLNNHKEYVRLSDKLSTLNIQDYSEHNMLVKFKTLKDMNALYDSTFDNLEDSVLKLATDLNSLGYDVDITNIRSLDDLYNMFGKFVSDNAEELVSNSLESDIKLDEYFKELLSSFSVELTATEVESLNKAYNDIKSDLEKTKEDEKDKSDEEDVTSNVINDDYSNTSNNSSNNQTTNNNNNSNNNTTGGGSTTTPPPTTVDPVEPPEEIIDSVDVCGNLDETQADNIVWGLGYDLNDLIYANSWHDNNTGCDSWTYEFPDGTYINVQDNGYWEVYYLGSWQPDESGWT